MRSQQHKSGTPADVQDVRVCDACAEARGVRERTGLTARVVSAALVVAVVAAGCGGGTSGAAAYDVRAARLCHAFNVFVVDARRGKDRVADSTALDSARQKLGSDPGPEGKWTPLVEGVAEFLTAATAGNGHLVDFDGLKIGQACAGIPKAAKRAGGYRG